MKIIKKQDRLKLGDCICLVLNKPNGNIRLANGSVARIPYNKNATKEDKKKYGKNMVYVCYTNNEDVIGYKQDISNLKKKNKKYIKNKTYTKKNKV